MTVTFLTLILKNSTICPMSSITSALKNHKFKIHREPRMTFSRIKNLKISKSKVIAYLTDFQKILIDLARLSQALKILELFKAKKISRIIASL